MDDEKIIDLFFSRSDKAISELSLKYGEMCFRVSENILHNKEDSEECVNETYFSVWNKIPPEHPNPLVSFVLKILRNIAINRYRHNTAKKRNSRYDACLDELSGCVSGLETTETIYEAKELSLHIDAFLEKHSKTNRMIFVRRYWYMDSISTLSEICGMSEGTIKTRLSRMRKELKAFLVEKGVEI